MHHAKGFSRKLRRRLTQRTIAEVRALKQQSAEAVHVLVYVAELVSNIIPKNKYLYKKFKCAVGAGKFS